VKLLLDTHVVLWLLAGSARISTDLYNTLADPRHTVVVSAVSAWEIAIKAGLGKLDLPADLGHWFPAEIAAAGLSVLPIDIDHALGVERLPPHHGDPFDRLLIAQAIIEGLTLVSADHVFGRYQVSLLPC
jgi:PIN domain nuclease of toxin-antitoxin system